MTTPPLLRRSTLGSLAFVLTAGAVLAAGPALAAASNGLSLVSRASSGAPADSDSHAPAVSGNGRYVCFDSTAGDIVAGDAVGTVDVFRHDTSTALTTLVSRTPAGAPAGRSTGCRISDSGRYLVYETTSPAVAPGLAGQGARIVLFDAVTRSAVIVSRQADGTPMTVRSHGVDLSGDGRYVVYADQSLSPGGGYHDYDVYRYDRVAGTTTSLVHEGEASRATLTAPSVSKDGRYVAYLRTPAPGKQVVGSASLYLLDTLTGTTVVVSATPKGVLNGAASPDLSDSGRFLAFSSNVAGLAPGDTTSADDVFLYDSTTGLTSLVSRAPSGLAGNERSFSPSLSGNGRYLAYTSNASDLVAGDDNSNPDVFRYDRLTGTTQLVSLSLEGGPSTAYSSDPCISRAGDRVVFTSPGTDLVAGDDSFHQDVFLWTHAQ